MAEWKPWEEFAKDVFDCPELPIKGPPCAECKFWSPRREFNRHDGSFFGVRLCHNPGEMSYDFSCFDPRAVIAATEVGRPCAWRECQNRLPIDAAPIRKYCSPECSEKGKREVDSERKRELREAAKRRHVPNRKPDVSATEPTIEPAAAEAVAEAIASTGYEPQPAKRYTDVDEFIRERGVTKCPTPGTPEFYELPAKPWERK